MLIRDLMRSRNLSQTFAVSRSRPTWVAVVIVIKFNEPKNTVFPQVCITCGKGWIALKHHALEILSAPERMFFAPVVPRGPVKLAGPRSTASKLDGFSRTVSGGAREKCREPSTNVHMAFTTFPQAQQMCK